ncbi:MAG TPA: hypothetical protein DCM08_05735 [Microscillaceae bacterium]|nr:hypothetical protein [Microscillaceae bacterium]
MYHISKDTLWKGIIEDLFDDFLHYFFPDWASQSVDFTKGFEFLDKELDELYPKPKGGQKRYADKLVKVFTREGQEQWLLIHIEVQGYADPNFTERMFDYFLRIRERWNQKIMALAILTDEKIDYHPKRYEYTYQDTRLQYEFATFKVLEKSEEALNIPENPFSIVMLTAKKALEKSNREDQAQLIWKTDLVKKLKEANYATDKIRKILNFIRYYVNFKKEDSLTKLNQSIQTTFKQRNCGYRRSYFKRSRRKK